MIIKQVKENIFVGDPFIYKFRPDFYPGIVNAVLKNPGMFDDISRLKIDVLSNKSLETIPEKLENYYQLIEANYNEENYSNTEDIVKTLIMLEEYRYFFKEMGASLKFNPLSSNKSAIQIRERANTLIHKYGDLIKPKALYRKIKVVIEDNNLCVEGTDIRFKSKKLSTYFGEIYENISLDNVDNTTKQMIIYVVTIGSGIDDTVKILGREGEIFDSYILNAIGAAAAEMVAEDLNCYFNNNLPTENIGQQYYRFSPGYGGWIVTEQTKLFSLLKPEKYIGVELTEGHIMLPEKSTSGIMGIKLSDNRSYSHSAAE